MLHIPQECQPLTIQLQLPREARSSEAYLLALSVQTANEYGEQAIYHKNLQRVGYVTGKMAGEGE